MPFKAGKSPTDVAKSFENEVKRKMPNKIKGALFTLAAELGANADQYVPIHFGTLINSRRMKIENSPNGNGYSVTIGYYTNYAAALHSPGARMDGWKPRPVPSPGKKTGGYNPAAKQGWLTVSWNENKRRLLKIFRKDIAK